MWDEEEKGQRGTDVWVTSGYIQGTDELDIYGYELIRLTHEDIDILHITSGLCWNF